MKIKFIIITLLTSLKLCAITPFPPEKPAVIINIVIDNLSSIEIDRNSALLSNNGILKLRNEGTSFANASYPYSSFAQASDYASISTGTTPRYHGIVSDHWYQTKTENFESCIASKTAILISDETNKKGVDANKLTASTLGDELKINTLGEAKVYSVSINNTAAVLMGGHAADGVFWLNQTTGQWITSDYYMSWLPDWVNNFNNKKFPDFYLSQDWVLSQKPSAYHIDKESNSSKTFPLSLSTLKSDKAPYKILSSTPMGNMLTMDFATDLIKNEQIGKDDITDLLYLNFSSITDKRLNESNSSIEKADFIVRLDKEITRLTEFLDKKIGANRYLIILCSTQTKGATVNQLKKQRMPTGHFSPERAKALLNSYLMALYGQGNWVLNFSNQQIFLNKELIEKSRLNFNDFQETVAVFMEEFSGIKWAVPAYKLKYSDFNDECFKAMQESYFPKRCGDVMISYYPGWAEENNNLKVNFTYSHNNKVVPLIMYGWKIERKIIKSEVYLTGLAPTLSTILNISIPNTSSKNLIYVELEN